MKYAHLIRSPNHLAFSIFETFDALVWNWFGIRLILGSNAIYSILRHSGIWVQ